MDTSQLANSIALGALQGVTEFLPISSTGHLILAGEWIGFADGGFSEVFDVVIQAGSVLAVILYFWRRILPLPGAENASHRRAVFDVWLKAGVGFLPAAALGALLKDPIQEHLYAPVPVAIALVVWGAAIVAIERAARPAPRYAAVSEMPLRTALLVGVAQCLAMVPGTSRSAATICAALLLGGSRVAAAELSFFLAIPTILGASAYSLLDARMDLSPAQWAALGAGFATAFAVSLAVVAFLMRFIARHSFAPFGWYRIALGLAVIAWCTL